ncbi:MAG: TetR/AcrR family transcriptional regulator [Actinomycetales bacterium]|nr:TetR/AcrR family transcriptional regulator [Actinomycetales bacterium]
MEERQVARRTTKDLVRDIRLAILEELKENGYPGVTFEGVARRARTSKPVIYRRYSSRAHMALDAWTWNSPVKMPKRSKGSLRKDLIAILEALQTYNKQAGVAAFRRMIAEADDDLMKQMTETTAEMSREAVQMALAAARVRGEIGDVPLGRALELLPIILFRHDVFFRRPSYEPKATEALVDDVLLPVMTALTGTKD